MLGFDHVSISIASILVALSGTTIFGLGAIHLLFTFYGTRLSPLDADLKSAMQRTPPRISAETSMWQAWVGFNASHSMGAMLFGAIYIFLAFVVPDLLFGSLFLAFVGVLFLGVYIFLAWRYWFRIPFWGILIASGLYGAGYVAALT